MATAPTAKAPSASEPRASAPIAEAPRAEAPTADAPRASERNRLLLLMQRLLESGRCYRCDETPTQNLDALSRQSQSELRRAEERGSAPRNNGCRGGRVAAKSEIRT